MSPEAKKGLEYSTQANDMYCLGMIFWILVSGEQTTEGRVLEDDIAQDFYERLTMP